jgi:hypothetical protein
VTADKPAWQVPAGWQEHPPTSMLLAKFLVTADAAKATVTVSRLEGDGGGLLPNVNRWRGQIGLPPIDQAGLEKLVSPREAPNRQTVLVDMAGGNTRMLAAVVPVAGQTWFFKFLGDTAAIEQQKAAFLQFVQSTKFTAP